MGWLAAAVTRLRRVNLADTLDQLHPADVLFFCRDVNRGASLEGKAYAPLLDSVRDDLGARGYSCEVVALPFSRLTGDLAHGSPRAMNRSYFIAWITSRLGVLTHIYRERKPVIALFSRILRRAKPRLVISIGSNRELAAACRQEGVRHAELMHGMGYTSIPWGWADYPAEWIPSDVLVLDDKTATVLEPLAERGLRIHRVANPFLKRFRTGTSLPQEWISRPPGSAASYRRRILVALTWGYAGDHGNKTEFAGVLENGLFPDVVRQMVEETAADTFWCFRLHPVQLRQPHIYRALLGRLADFCKAHPNCDWEWSSLAPLPSVLKECSGLVTMISMTSYDAAAMNIPSLILCPTTTRPDGKHWSMFDDLVAAGIATKADWSPAAARDWLDRATGEGPARGWVEESDGWDAALKEMLPDQREFQ